MLALWNEVIFRPSKEGQDFEDITGYTLGIVISSNVLKYLQSNNEQPSFLCSVELFSGVIGMSHSLPSE